jgi:hypothetical protein
MVGNGSKKLEHVEMKTPFYVQERRNELKINRDAAERLIARYLRERISPADAIGLARRICDGMLASMSTPVRPSLRGYRMIAEHPPYGSMERIGAQIRALRIQEDRHELARDAWGVVYGYGEALPDDVVV